MKLKNFYIKKFRCILDSWEVYLSWDNITTIIGQNESGKSTILDGLYAFYSWIITLDDLDQTIIGDEKMPQIMCTFECDPTSFSKEVFSDEYIKKLKLKEHKITVIRSRNVDLSTNVFDIAADDDLCEDSEDYYQLIEYIKSYMPEFIIFKANSLLPEKIPLEDIKETKSIDSQTTWRESVLHLLKMLDIDSTFFETSNDVNLDNKIERLNVRLNTEIWLFRKQFIWKERKIKINFKKKIYQTWEETYNPATQAWKPYLQFDISDKIWYKPHQRSDWVKRFLAFFLQLWAIAKRDTDNEIVYLIDEPGTNLHANAQRDLLTYFETRANDLNIIFTTHSPFLLDDENIHRIIAVEREDNEDDDSVIYSKVYNFNMIWRASWDTLFWLTSKIWMHLSDQSEIKKKNNIILEEMSALFYIKAFSKLLSYDFENDYAFIPCTWVSNISKYANLLTGRWLWFIAVMDDDRAWKTEFKKLKFDNWYDDNVLIKMDWYDGIEDLFTVNDFEKHLLREWWLSDCKNSQYVKDNGTPKAIKAKILYIAVQKEEITASDFDENTKSNFKNLLDAIKSKLI